MISEILVATQEIQEIPTTQEPQEIVDESISAPVDETVAVEKKLAVPKK